MRRRRPKAKPSKTPRKVPHAGHKWQLQDAKAQFSHVVREAQKAPQIITVRGEEVAVIQSADAFRQQQTPPKEQVHWLDRLLECPRGPELTVHRDPKDIVGAGTPGIFD